MFKDGRNQLEQTFVTKDTGKEAAKAAAPPRIAPLSIVMLAAMPDMVGDVFAFHRAFGVLPGQPLTVPRMARVLNRQKWVREELHELEVAAGQEDIVEFVDAVADAVYFLLGHLWDAGVTPEQFYAAWDEVQRSNMAKLGGPVLPSGKRGKPEGWKPPAIRAALGLDNLAIK